MASCRLCWKGLREQFVGKSDSSEYVHCSNRACGYFCSLDELASYERVVQMDMARAFRGGDAPLCQHQKACALMVSCWVKNGGRPYFTCWERWPCTFFCWADLEVTLRPLPSQQTLWRRRSDRERRIAVCVFFVKCVKKCCSLLLITQNF